MKKVIITLTKEEGLNIHFENANPLEVIALLELAKHTIVKEEGKDDEQPVS